MTRVWADQGNGVWCPEILPGVKHGSRGTGAGRTCRM